MLLKNVIKPFQMYDATLNSSFVQETFILCPVFGLLFNRVDFDLKNKNEKYLN